MHKRLLTLITLAALTAACSDATTFTKADLPKLVLQPAEAPDGTSYDTDSSGFQTLDQYVEDDEGKKRLFQAAGFQTSYFAQFLDPSFLQSNGTAGGIAVSFAMLFESSDGAGRGLRALQRSVRAEGEDLEDRPGGGLGEEAFGLAGVIDPAVPGHPSGFMYAWRSGNAVFGVIAVGPKDTIGEPAVRQLAEVVDQRTTPA